MVSKEEKRVFKGVEGLWRKGVTVRLQTVKGCGYQRGKNKEKKQTGPQTEEKGITKERQAKKPTYGKKHRLRREDTRERLLESVKLDQQRRFG
jgi:deoxyxylulose-5-phosphate synthase